MHSRAIHVDAQGKTTSGDGGIFTLEIKDNAVEQ